MTAYDVGLLILRLVLGLTMAVHGYHKFFGGGRIKGTAGWFESIGMKPGVFCFNPPYGVRVSGSRDLRNLYAQFGNVMRAKCPAWHVAILCDSERLVHNTGLKFDQAHSVSLVNGGLKVRLSRGRVP